MKGSRIGEKGQVSLERAFVKVARMLLKEETYDMLMEAAKEAWDRSKDGDGYNGG